MNTKELIGREVLKVRKTALVRDYNKDSKLAGEKYQIFSYQDKAFIVNLKDPFMQDFTNANVYSIELGVSDEGLSLFNYTTIDQEVRMAKTDAILSSIKVSASGINVVTNPEELV